MSRNWISLPRTEGEASRQAHCDLPQGSYERELGREGFFGPATHMYHRHRPTDWIRFEGDLKPRAFDTTHLGVFGPTPWGACGLMHNAQMKFRFWRMQSSMEQLARNADGDELIFIHEGAGHLFCDYGHLEVREGDYVVIPRGTMWRLESNAPMAMLLIEATGGSYMLPDKGMLGPHAIFDPAILDVPALDERFFAQQDDSEWEIQVKSRGNISKIIYPFNPLDAIGWKGDLVPVRVNWRDIRPVLSDRYHLPPSAHTTFIAKGFVVCTFAPRPFETDPGALKVPFYHNNDDYDEVIFYHRGEFFSRDNIHPGMITCHPAGFTHGPHPKAMSNAFEQKSRGTDEVAVMIDTRDSLTIDEQAEPIEWGGYVDSWKTS
ncbi:MAG: homogentisate 1,2-dioxygenase [Gammaproteobacteria bacterium]|jgi:homogentisate 1,2-dioxygenase|nr:homogentisate 1,2-dioxygenase [Gammaproteobacteria bacterium]